MKPGEALTALSLKDLEALLTRLYRGELTTPIGALALHRAGLSYLADKVQFLHGLDARGAQAVLVAVIAERRKVAKTR